MEYDDQYERAQFTPIRIGFIDTQEAVRFLESQYAHSYNKFSDSYDESEVYSTLREDMIDDLKKHDGYWFDETTIAAQLIDGLENGNLDEIYNEDLFLGLAGKQFQIGAIVAYQIMAKDMTEKGADFDRINTFIFGECLMLKENNLLEEEYNKLFIAEALIEIGNTTYRAHKDYWEEIFINHGELFNPNTADYTWAYIGLGYTIFRFQKDLNTPISMYNYDISQKEGDKFRSYLEGINDLSNTDLT